MAALKGAGHTTEREQPEPNPEARSDRFGHASERVGMGGPQVRVRCRVGGREEHPGERKAYRMAWRCE